MWGVRCLKMSSCRLPQISAIAVGALISLKYIYFEIYDALSDRATDKFWDYIFRTDDEKNTKSPAA